MNNLAKLTLYLLIFSTSLFDIKYEQIDKEVNGKPENIYVMDIDMNNKNVDVMNVLSFDKLYGFETLGEMASRHEANYAVNGMFYNDFGQPYGTLIENGELVFLSSLDVPKVIIDYEGNIYLDDCSFEVNAVHEGKRYRVNSVNNILYSVDQFALYNDYNGSTTRVDGLCTNYVIKSGKVTEKVVSTTPFNIEEDELILARRGEDYSFKVGDEVDIEVSNTLGIEGIKTVFTTGGWLVKDGKNIAKENEPFIGPTNSLQPRTIVGIDGKRLVFIVVDGRSKISKGITGKECADILIENGIKNGGYLDGGSSSTMIIEGKVVNNIIGDKQRNIAHGILIKDKGKSK